MGWTERDVSTPYHDQDWEEEKEEKEEKEGDEDKGNISLDSLFWDTWKELGYKIPDNQVDDKLSYSFVLVSPVHRYITQYSSPGIYLVGVRDLNKQTWLDTKTFADKYAWKVPPRTSIDGDLATWVKKFTHTSMVYRNSPFSEKGFFVFPPSPADVKVAQQPSFQIWNKEHVSLACASCNLSGIGPFNTSGNLDQKNVAFLSLYNTSNLFLNYYPEWKPNFYSECSAYTSLIEEIQDSFDSLLQEEQKLLKEGKTFTAQNSPFTVGAKNFWEAPILFKMKKWRIYLASEYFLLEGYTAWCKTIKYQAAKQKARKDREGK
eukprot:TRINITY_DN5165_c0_g1_i2.p2 TRINITY_DN5165_c0_g1~~TRINITY_DN5165_c0_g1_i2.p2  ORF type:complete len:319 (+),score=56.80 TRINITY_DN5165_c0_g1_i2:1303-2259(+)